MLTPEEQAVFDMLAKKNAEPSITTEDGSGKVIRLIPGGKQDDVPLVEKLRVILKDAEAGRYTEFVFVGLESNALRGANLQWSPGTTSTCSNQMLGAFFRSLAFLSK